MPRTDYRDYTAPSPDGVAAKYGADLDKAVEAHADDETRYDRELMEITRQASKALKEEAPPAVERPAKAPSGLEALASLPPPPVPSYHDDIRAAAKLLSFLTHPTPEREALLKAAGVGAPSGRYMKELAELTLKEIDSDRASELFDTPWDKMPYPGRDERPPCEGINTRRLSEVMERDVEWLWWQRFPIGYLSLVSGDPDLGKTWLILDILARVTTGREMPDGSPNPFGEPRDVLWVSAEDADDDTVKPRLMKLGGEPSRVHSFRFTRERVAVGKDGKQSKSVEANLDLSRHLAELDFWLREHPMVAAAAFDPLAAFCGRVDTNRNSDVRTMLTPLTKLAEKHRVAFLGNNHLSKGDSDNAKYRAIGSIAFVAAARSSWMVTEAPDGPGDRRLFTKVKCNPQREDVAGMSFRVGPAVSGAFLWEQGEVKVTADEALRALQPNEDTKAPARAEAVAWLRDTLKDGPMLASEVLSKAKADMLCEKTLRAAKEALGVRTVKTGGAAAPWEWTLPQPRKAAALPSAGCANSWEERGPPPCV